MEYQSKTDVVTAELRALIQAGQLEPGAVLRQRELAERFGVSPTPVREALRRLEAEGFVITELHREATVVPVDDGRLEENLLIMANLEALAAGLAAEKVTDEDLDDLAAIHDDLRSVAPGDVAALLDLNRRFHFRIYEAARSPVLISLLNLLWRSATAQLPALLPPADVMAAEHAALLEALRRRSANEAMALTRAHIMGTGPGVPVEQPDAAEAAVHQP